LTVPRIFRCYAIWDFQRKVIVFPTICAIGTAFMGYVNAAGLFSSDRPDTDFGYNATAFFIAIMMSLFTTVILVRVVFGGWRARRG